MGYPSMTGSWTSLVSAAWAALGSGGVVVGRSRVDMRRCVIGVLGRVVMDCGGIELSGDSVVVSEYDPLAIALATSRSVDESREGIVVWGVGRWVVME